LFKRDIEGFRKNAKILAMQWTDSREIIRSLHRVFFPLASVLLALPLPADQLPSSHAEKMKAGIALFKEKIRPAFVEHCLKCHGDEKVRSGLDISTRELLLEGGDSDDAINLEKPSESYLLALIRHEVEDLEMPPKNDKLSGHLIKDFERWIALGAPYDKPLLEKDGQRPLEMQVTKSDREFWSFAPLSFPKPPEVNAPWVKTEIDRFLAVKLKENKLEPNPPATSHARIRRAYLDLIGLPPTSQQVKAALKISHAELIDELLASPHYGERWARHWLDAARFAESHGFEQDYDRKHAYHYRDFVIKALNSNMPWNQFIQWQLAGDEIAPDDPLALMATGFLGAGVFPTQLTEKEFESARYDELDDMAATTGTAMLGLTIGCARCHDHKFDPIPEKDYYRFVSHFTTTIRSEIDIDLDSKEYREALKKWKFDHDRTVAALKAYEQDTELSKSFQAWIKTEALSESTNGDWFVLNVSEAVSSQKATSLTVQPNGALLASGNPPARETYTLVTAPTIGEIRSIRIEALTHSSMKGNGPGRASNGNFALSDLKIFTSEAGGQKQLIPIASAKATHQQNEDNLSVSSSFDNQPDQTGWAVDFGGIGKDQAAVFHLAQPIKVTEETKLELQLRFSNNSQHSMGHFRISTSSLSNPPVSVGAGINDKLKQALIALKNNRLEEKHHDPLFSLFIKNNPKWNSLTTAVQKSSLAKPVAKKIKVQVTSEGFPPTKHHADGRGFPHFYPETHFLNRGDPNQKNGVATPGLLQVLMRNGKDQNHWKVTPPAEWKRTSYRRTSLANWITDTKNGAGHLLARVAVNRIWHHHFGRGIVSTPNDFGLQGSEPSHPKLLDFLANRFIESGWNVKALHKEIMLTAAWQQSSAPSPHKSFIDPNNNLLWRFTPRRLEAEIVRDSILSASGQLDPTMYGPGTLDESHQRRSIYFMIKRSRLIPMMQIFDQPEPLVSQGSRPSTTIAPQALHFLNNPEVVKWAGALAVSITNEDLKAAIRALYFQTLCREPTTTELQENCAFIEAQEASYGDAKNARQLAIADLTQVIFSLNEFIYLP